MILENSYHKLPDRFYKETNAKQFSNPQLLLLNKDLLQDLGMDINSYSEMDLAQIFSGQKLLEGSKPIALAYAGHQFGQFVHQLGDGRAMLLGEVINSSQQRFDIQLKGSGQTFFSRRGDGYSSLGPVIREYIVSEAMYHLGVPTTRALAAVSTGDLVFREEPLPGAVFTRLASSHIRVGTFQYFAAREDIEGLKILLDYSIQRHFPEITSNSAISFLQKVIEVQTSLIAHWVSLGFIHGVMNTDNMSISGETIDYGPCAFMDIFNNNQVYSYIDNYGRYAYNNQGNILYWNLTRLAECLIPLVHSDEKTSVNLLNEELLKVPQLFKTKWLQRMKAKLGINSTSINDNDESLVLSWLEYLEKEKLDFTLSFRMLSNLIDKNTDDNSFHFFKKTRDFESFLSTWKMRLTSGNINPETISQEMNKVNPIYTPRNHQVERAIQQAIRGDLSVVKEMNEVLKSPYSLNPMLDIYKEPPLPEEEITNTFCGT